MIIKFLYSSSSGNSTIVENDDTSILIDAGVSYKKLKEANNNEDIKLDAIFVTHEHSDHIKSLGVIGRKTKAVIFIPELAYEVIKKNLAGCKINFIKGGESVNVKSFSISAISTRHDSKESVAYKVKDAVGSYGHITDTGVITPLIRESVEECDSLFIEADYDMYELDRCDYDDFLKERISSNNGHLSNQQVIKYLIDDDNLKNLEWVMIGHLSDNSNSKEILENLINKYVESGLVSKINIFDKPMTLTI